MKRLVHILVLAMVLTSCTPSVETRHGTSLPTDDMHQRLAAIDTLMWRHPDSSLAVLLDFAASPYHSWERGANENMNGLIRQYVPKGSSFENLTDEYIELIQNKLNNRPRKRLGFLTPIEYFITKFAPDIKLNINKVAFVT